MMVLQEGVKADAAFSDDGTYRYRLERWWAEEKASRNWVTWVMLNPSVASADVDDPTVRRCQAFARRWGYEGIVVVNLFALRSTDPKALVTHPRPVGPLNDLAIQAAVTDTALTVAAWGTNGSLYGRADEVVARIKSTGVGLHHLGKTQFGHPKHPLARGKHYIPDYAGPVPW